MDRPIGIRIEPNEDQLKIIQEHTLVEAASLVGHCRDTIRRWRRQHLPKLDVRVGRPKRALSEDLIAALGTAPDSHVAARFNIPKNSVRNYRIERNIPPFVRTGLDCNLAVLDTALSA